MNNNDRFTRLRYALDIKNDDLLTIFALGGVMLTKDELVALMERVPNEDAKAKNIYQSELSDEQFERFLNGLITSQRGPKEGAGEPKLELNARNVNNIILKKVKIALSLTSHDILDIFNQAGLDISNSELSAVFRKEGHRNYRPCGDRYMRNFLKGLAMDYRN